MSQVRISNFDYFNKLTKTKSTYDTSDLTVANIEYLNKVFEPKSSYGAVCFLADETKNENVPFFFSIANMTFEYYMNRVKRPPSIDFTTMTKEEIATWSNFAGAKTWTDIKNAYVNILFSKADQFKEPFKIVAIKDDFDIVVKEAIETMISVLKNRVLE
jgi:hypothetical protein